MSYLLFSLSGVRLSNIPNFLNEVKVYKLWKRLQGYSILDMCETTVINASTILNILFVNWTNMNSIQLLNMMMLFGSENTCGCAEE